MVNELGSSNKSRWSCLLDGWVRDSAFSEPGADLRPEASDRVATGKRLAFVQRRRRYAFDVLGEERKHRIQVAAVDGALGAAKCIGQDAPADARGRSPKSADQESGCAREMHFETICKRTRYRNLDRDGEGARTNEPDRV
jgi:hypothetical protein